MFLSITEMMKIGVGPSRSHMMGLMTAAARFIAERAHLNRPQPTKLWR